MVLDAHKLGISLIEKIENQGFSARFAGGSVRDRLLGLAPHDYDIATDALPEQICSIFNQKTHKVIPTGLDHGTVTVVYRTIPFEITTLRKDVQTDGRHAEVAFGGSFQEDAERRDFTVNAMFEDAAGKVYDYFGGQEDLAAKNLRFVGEPAQRIKEDYLRILRYFRFWAKLGFNPDEPALAAIKAHCGGLAQISVERITSEVLRMFAAGPSAAAPLEAMMEGGVWQQILGARPTGVMDQLTRYWQAVPNDEAPEAPLIPLALVVAAAAGGPAESAQIEGILTKRFRLSNPQNRFIRHFLDVWASLGKVDTSTTAASMAILDDCDKAAGKGQAFLPLYHPALAAILTDPVAQAQLAQLADIETRLSERRLAKLPVTGKDLAAIGIPMDKRCGEILAALKAAYRNGEWDTKEEGLLLAGGGCAP